MTVDIVIAGVLGKMGREIALAVVNDAGTRLVGCTEVPSHPGVGQRLGDHIGRKDIDIPIRGSLEGFALDNAVVVDLTAPKATLALLDAIKGPCAGLVIGTTGINDAQAGRIREASQRYGIVFSPNMSVGVNLLFYLTEIVAAKTGKAFDIEIIEAHHREKKDSPSGTAKRLAEIAAESRGFSYDRNVRHGRLGLVGERPDAEIGMHAVRGGDIVGDHTVLFAGPGERLELRHMAHSRATFAQGAVAAAKWVCGRQKGLYTMRDVLGI